MKHNLVSLYCPVDGAKMAASKIDYGLTWDNKAQKHVDSKNRCRVWLYCPQCNTTHMVVTRDFAKALFSKIGNTPDDVIKAVVKDVLQIRSA